MSSVEYAREYYASFDEREWSRLESAEGRIEFAITQELLAPLLPGSGRVLDIGGGPGRYARWLSSIGLNVSLADLSPNLLDIARRELPEGAVSEIVEADVRDLSRWSEDAFDATIALGPFYHLTSFDDREAAIVEIIRVTKPGGMIAVALMPRYGFLRRTLSIPDERHRMTDGAFVRKVLDLGVFENDIPGRFTEGYGVSSASPEQLFEQHGLTTVLTASTHGFAAGIEEAVDELRTEDPRAYQEVLHVLAETAQDPSLFGLTSHLIWIGRKPDTSKVG